MKREMEYTEPFSVEKLDIALTYIGRMAEGKNPVNNRPMPNDAALENPNVIRCMFFVRDVLAQVKDNDGYVKGRKPRQAKEVVPAAELASRFTYRADKPVSFLLRQIYEPVEDRNVKRLSAVNVTSWLRANGYLKEERSEEEGKSVVVPTEKGKSVGIYSETREKYGKSYSLNIYGKDAQELIVRNLQKIESGETENTGETGLI